MSTLATSSALLRAAQICVREYLCVDKADNVLITTDDAGDQKVVSALFAALYLEGVRGSVLTIPQLPLQGSLADPFMPATVLGAAMHCDAWIDLTYPYIAGSHAQSKAMERRAMKYLLGSDLKSDSMVWIFGDCDIHAVTAVMEQ